MSTRKENIKVNDSCGFHYEVELVHQPHFGFSNALYQGGVIAQVQLGRITEPFSDSDREWEEYEQRFSEWTDEIKINITPQCVQYFDSHYQKAKVR